MKGVASVNISRNTVLRRLKEFDIMPRVAAKKEFLKASHISDRLKFALAFGSKTTEWWNTVIYSVEKTFGYV